MKKNILKLSFLALGGLLSAQFSVKVDVPSDFKANQAFLYAYNGSQETIAANGVKKGEHWTFKVENPYSGIMKVYFPSTNDAFMLVTENKDVQVKAFTSANKISTVEYGDTVNKVFKDFQDNAKKKDQILPILLQMQTFYSPSSDFGIAMKKEIANLSAYQPQDLSQYPFLSFYTQPLEKYTSNDPNVKQEDYINFINTAPEYLESSAQIRQVLVNYLQKSAKTSADKDIDKMLKAVDIESPRGQMVLSEFIDIFDLYGLDDLKAKYLNEAKSLKCTITDRLNKTITDSDKVAVGATFANYTFNNPIHTKAKSIYDVKAKHKLIMFWSSGCSHCEAELPKIIEKYAALKNNRVEIIGLSVDADEKAYKNRAESLPWINDSELKGWNSSVANTYNVHATPYYFLLDANNKIVAKPNNFAEAISILKIK